jgi:hypothetical protein
MTADVTFKCVRKTINFVLIHAKANTSPTITSYNRRQAAANELHDTLMTYFPAANVIVLGDFNDDLDQTITDGINPPNSSYKTFTDDNTNFFSPTLALSLAGKKSTVSFNDVIDHVMLSNDFQPYYMPSTAAVLTDVAGLVSNYGTTTTDHYPVFTRYRFESPTPPAITCPQNVEKSNDAGVCGAVVNYTVTVEDICGGAVLQQTAGLASGSTFPIGTTVNTYLATDANGNTATCSFTVKINDTEKPTISCPGNIVTLNDAATCGIVVNYPAISFHDNCTVTLQQTAGLPSGSTFPIGTTTNTFVATDASGNTATCSFDVTVNYHTSSFGPVTVFAGVTNSDDNGRRIDLLAELYLNGNPIGSAGTLSNVQVSGNTLNNCSKFLVPLNVSNVIYTPSDLLELKISVRRVGGTGNFGVRLWYNADSINNSSRGFSRMRKLTPEGPAGNYFNLRNSFKLDPAAGNAGISSTLTATTSYQSFGTWSTTAVPHCAIPTVTKNSQQVQDVTQEITALQVKVAPNPSTDHFNLYISSNNNLPVTIRVSDAYGRLISQQATISSNSYTQIGSELMNGLYIAEIIQGKERRVVKLVKIK